MKKPFSYHKPKNGGRSPLTNFSRHHLDTFNGEKQESISLNNTFSITPSTITTKKLPPAIKQWMNSIYSFNKNYTKNLPAVDTIVNKIIKSFFSINPLANNPGGKKSRLVQRRFKRLSLNRIFVSKPEIKHSNDKVFITVYLFNKKKKSLLYKLKHLYENLTYKNTITSSDKESKSSSQSTKSIGITSNTLVRKSKKVGFGMLAQRKKRYILSGRAAARLYRKHKKLIGKSNSLYRFIKKSNKINAGHSPLFNKNKYKNFYSSKFATNSKNKINVLKNKGPAFYSKVLNYKKLSNLTKTKLNKFIVLLNNKTNNSVMKSKVLVTTYNNRASNMGSGLLTTSNNKNSYLTLTPSFTRSSAILKNYYYALNKYKLYSSVLEGLPLNDKYILNFGITMKDNNSNSNYLSKPLLQGQALTTNVYKYLKLRENFILGLYRPSALSRKMTLTPKTLVRKGKLNISVQKVKALYKLFTLYNNINFYNNNTYNSKVSNTLDNLSIYSSKILWNTYKLLKKSFTQITDTTFSSATLKKNSRKGGSAFKKVNLSLTNKNLLLAKAPLLRRRRTQLLAKPINKFLSLYDKNRLNRYKARLLWLRKVKGKRLSRTYITRAIRNIMLLKKLNKINRFFKKYKKVLFKKNSLVNNNFNLVSENSVATTYKLNFIKEILNKELLYVYYIKMLSFNNNIFKNWFLNSLKNIISKIYNKKVILNLVSLKYIHLNSDIFTQAITVRLRNFKKNRLNKVLRKALKLVVLSKINIYSYDIHSPVNKFIEEYYSKFKHLNMDIFSDLASTSSSKNSRTLVKSNSHLTPQYSPMTIKGLNYVQSNTINFIRHKSVFGVRLEAAGRLTKRSTASRAIFKIRYKGSLRNNTILNRSDSSTSNPAGTISNLQFTKISSKTRNGSFGLKGWLNNN